MDFPWNKFFNDGNKPLNKKGPAFKSRAFFHEIK